VCAENLASAILMMSQEQVAISPCAPAVVCHPTVHAEDVQGVHRIKADPFSDGVGEFDVAIEFVPRLSGSDKIEHLLVQVDHVGALGRDVGFGGRAAMANVDDLDILL
jgi:pentose-5-phosphate-3-epimerase